MSRVAYVNGAYLPHGQAAIHIEDRGYQFADGVYEVCAVLDGRLIDRDFHLDRLERSLAALAIPMPMGRAALMVVLGEVVRRNRIVDGLLYLQATRGVARRDHVAPAGLTPALVITARRIDRAALDARAAQGVAVKSVADIRWGRCDIKATGLLPNVMAKLAAQAAGATEAWFVDGAGKVTEGASTNAWMVDGEGRVITRALSNAILPGVTRRALLAVAAAEGLAVVERAFTLDEATAAREAFITSATAFVTPVIRIDDKPVGNGRPGPLAMRLRMAYLEQALAGGV